MSQVIAPWSPYLEAEAIVSSGRRSLISAFGDFVLARREWARYELPGIFAEPEDNGENDACRHMILLDAASLTAQFVLGKIATFSRPIGGGEIVAIPAEHWEIDNPLPRIATGAFNRESWADQEAPLTHRIFVDGPGFEEWLAGLQPLGPLTNREIEEAIDPQLRATRAVAARRIAASSPVGEQSGSDQSFALNSSPHEAADGMDLLKRDEVLALVKFGHSSLYNKIRDEGFPEPIKLGAASRWRRREVLMWIEEQAAKRGTKDG